jgi:hypothetical protein
MKENYYALIAAILGNISVDQSIARMGLQERKITNRKKFDQEENKVMAELRDKGMTYAAIGELYDLSAGSIDHRVRSYRNGQKNKNMPIQ